MSSNSSSIPVDTIEESVLATAILQATRRRTSPTFGQRSTTGPPFHNECQNAFCYRNLQQVGLYFLGLNRHHEMMEAHLQVITTVGSSVSGKNVQHFNDRNKQRWICSAMFTRCYTVVVKKCTAKLQDRIEFECG